MGPGIQVRAFTRTFRVWRGGQGYLEEMSQSWMFGACLHLGVAQHLEMLQMRFEVDFHQQNGNGSKSLMVVVVRIEEESSDWRLAF